MPEFIEARVPVRHATRLERIGRIEPAAATAAAAPAGLLGTGPVPAILDAFDIVVAATLQSLFNVIKR